MEEELTTLKLWLEINYVVLSKIQNKVPGLPLTVRDRNSEEASSRSLQPQDNSSTSVVSEYGDLVEKSDRG